MTAPKLGRRVLSCEQRFLLRKYSHWVRDGDGIPAADRGILAAAMERAGAPTAADARRLVARERSLAKPTRSKVKKK